MLYINIRALFREDRKCIPVISKASTTQETQWAIKKKKQRLESQEKEINKDNEKQQTDWCRADNVESVSLILIGRFAAYIHTIDDAGYDISMGFPVGYGGMLDQHLQHSLHHHRHHYLPLDLYNVFLLFWLDLYIMDSIWRKEVLYSDLYGFSLKKKKNQHASKEKLCSYGAFNYRHLTILIIVIMMRVVFIPPFQLLP